MYVSGSSVGVMKGAELAQVHRKGDGGIPEEGFGTDGPKKYFRIFFMAVKLRKFSFG